MVADRGRAGGAGRTAEESAAELLDSLEIDADAREAILARAEVSAAAAGDARAGARARPARPGQRRAGAERSPAVTRGSPRLGRRGSAAGRARRSGARGPLARRCGATASTSARDARLAARRLRDRGARAARSTAIAFEPGLAAGDVEALASVRYGHAAKLFVPLAEPAAPSATLAVPDRYWAWTATRGRRTRPQPVVSAFAGSPPALERLGVDDGPGALAGERLRACARTSRSSRDGAVLVDLGRRSVGPRRLLGRSPRWGARASLEAVRARRPGRVRG